MKLISTFILCLALASCHEHPEDIDYGPINIAFAEYLEATEAEAVFLLKYEKGVKRVVAAAGETTEEMYAPVKYENDLVVRTIDKGYCLVVDMNKTSNTSLKEEFIEKGWTFAIVCPTHSNGYVGANFKNVPSVEALGLHLDLVEEINDYL